MLLNKLTQEFDFSAQSLKLRAYRQQLLASNIANADTPNYKAVDIDFAAELKRIQSKQPGDLRLAASHRGHMQSVGNPLGAAVQYRVPSQPSLDGNSVDMDVERGQFAENALRYESTLRLLNGQIKSLMTAIKGQ